MVGESEGRQRKYPHSLRFQNRSVNLHPKYFIIQPKQEDRHATYQDGWVVRDALWRGRFGLFIIGDLDVLYVATAEDNEAVFLL